MGYNVVAKSLKLLILPDEDMVGVIEQNIGNARFVWNNILSRYLELYCLFQAHNCPLRPNISNFNAILKMLKVEFPFLREGESTSQQQVLIDLIKAFSRFFKNISGHPNFKSKKNAHPSFRIQKNGNNIKITNKRIKLAKLGYIPYQTSPEYRKLLKTCTINNVDCQKRKWKILCNCKTYICVVSKLKHTGEVIGIDFRIKKSGHTLK
jgi:putative transposase